MRKFLAILVIVALLSGSLFFLLMPKEAKSGMLFSLSQTEIQAVIEKGTSWMKNAQEDSGHFRYEYMPFLDRYIDDDNMVRQAGALYVLGELFIRDNADKFDLKDYIIRAISYFEENSTTGTFNGKKFQCILKTDKKCSIGAAALAFIGILDLVEKKPSLESEYNELIGDYLDYFLAMKKPGAGFRNSYYVKGTQDDTESSFGNGEAFLALTRYYKHNPTDEVKEVIDESFDYFNETYYGDFDSNFYLWGMAAIKELYALDPKDEYYTFVKDYTDWRIRPYKSKRISDQNRCAYIEGVASAYSVLEPNLTEQEREYYLEEISYWLFKSEDLQIKAADVLIMKLGRKKLLERLPIEKKGRATGGFLTNLDEPVQRIDFTQHSLSSYDQKLVDIDGGEF